MTLPLPLTPSSAPLTTPDDVPLAAKGDRRAFERVYRSHVDRVFSVCVRMVGDRVRAEELTQDVFVRCWEKLPTFRGDAKFSTWLHRLAVNVVLNEREVEGYTHEEIGTMLGVTAGGCKAQLHRARMLLRRVLTQ